MRLAWLSLLALCLAIVPAMAQEVYDNGPANGNTDAWSINSGFVVSDTFTAGFPGGGADVTGLAFVAWLFPGDVLTSAEVSITSDEFGGTTFFDGVVDFTQSGCVTNQAGFNVCTETGSFDATLRAGTFWLTLDNALTNAPDDAVYWDENSGLSSASQSSLGTIPSETFTILGSNFGEGSPEPGSFVLFGSGVLGLACVLRRKLF